MRTFIRSASSWCRAASGLLALLAFSVAVPAAANTGFIIDLEGPLGAATAEYIVESIDEANAADATLIVLRIDTPGGLVSSMREISQAILNSDVPVIGYVTPAGGEAASAGTYILLACHVAAMTPTTYLGAATPVSVFGEGPAQDDGEGLEDLIEAIEQAEEEKEPPDTEAGDAEPTTAADEAPPAEESEPAAPQSAMENKVLNAMIASIRALADRYGRNADWAEDAVRHGATLTAREALEENVIEFVADDIPGLLAEVDGREVRMHDGQQTLTTSGITMEVIEPSWRTKFLNTIASPSVIVVLFALGFYGLLLEGYNPGAIVPGVVGVISLLLVAYALQIIPVNYAGVALMAVGVILIVAEAFAPSFGALGLGGIVAFIFGAIMTFDSGIPGFGISIPFIVTFAIITGLTLLWLVSYLVRLQSRGPVSGVGSIIGGTGVAMAAFEGEGKVWLEGEAWKAESKEAIEKDQEVVVTELDGLVLHVQPKRAD